MPKYSRYHLKVYFKLSPLAFCTYCFLPLFVRIFFVILKKLRFHLSYCTVDSCSLSVFNPTNNKKNSRELNSDRLCIQARADKSFTIFQIIYTLFSVIYFFFFSVEFVPWLFNILFHLLVFPSSSFFIIPLSLLHFSWILHFVFYTYKYKYITWTSNACHSIVLTRFTIFWILIMPQK